MVSATFFLNSRFEFLSNMINQCFIFAPILSFELVEALVPNYAYTPTNKNICLLYIYMNVTVYNVLYIYYNRILCPSLNEMLSFTYDYFYIS